MGEELNYSSDIDLLFIAAANAGEYLELAKRLIEAISSVTNEGFLYRVDMRLRPWGNDGSLVSTMAGYLSYLGKNARLWEKQALLKVRPIAGDLRLGAEFQQRAWEQIFGADVESVRASVHAMKQRTEQTLKQQGRNWGEVKLGEGSIRDIEFVAQFLQLAHGQRQPAILAAATLEALPRLAAAGLISAEERRVLTDGYIFLRTVEHYLQMMHYRQTYTLPSEPEALALLARRLGFSAAPGPSAAPGLSAAPGPSASETFLARYQEHSAAVRAIYLRHVGNITMNVNPPETEAASVRQHLARLDSSYVLTFSESDIQRHADLASLLDAERLVVVDAVHLEENRWRATIVGYDYPGELALICGLMFVYGLNILNGEVFTYEPLAAGTPPAIKEARRKIVDVFTVESVQTPRPAWESYADDLLALLRKTAAGQRREARGELVKRVGAAFQEKSEAPAPLLPIEIEIDNTLSERYTVLRIDAPDTIGFLYEFTNALAIYRVYIARVLVQSVGSRVHDVLFVTDFDGRKITTPEKQRELRAATVLIKHFTHLLPHSPNPESALLHFRDFLAQLFQRPNWPNELASIERSTVLDALARVLGVSDFLWDDFLRMQYTNLFPVVRDVDALKTAKSRAELQRDLTLALQSSEVLETSEVSWEVNNWRAALNAFKDREMFRIDMRHILGHTPDFWAFAAELTDLAELVVMASFERCLAELTAAHGSPLQEDGQPCPLTICALGKCGGRELGFASDIELMFLYGGKGRTNGGKPLTTGEFFEKLVTAFVASIQARQEGIFQVDLQLRPYGKAGSMAVSLEAFKRYYTPDGPAWAYERQALVKLRPLAGDAALGEQISALRDAFVYRPEAFDVTAMRAMRERQIRHLVTGGTFNAKYSPGGLVDIEYLIQGLQILHGAEHAALRCSNSREAMLALYETGVITEEDYARLRKAHTFLRWLIDSLRVVRGNARDVTIPPYESEEFAFLARRLLYGADVARLRQDLSRYAAEVVEISGRLLGGEK